MNLMKAQNFIIMFAALALSTSVYGQDNVKAFVCLPCGYDCDKQVHDAPGQCIHCNMPLVKKSTIRHTSVEAENVCEFINDNPGLVLLDVRTKEEFEGSAEPNFGTLKNAFNIPVQELESRLSELNRYKEKTILVFCSHSHRSPRASYLLTQNGFKKVVNMEGGMSVFADDRCRQP